MSHGQRPPIILDAQETLRLPLTGIKLIEASAGTGKTYAISNLYLRYVLEGYRVAQILVVTFTNAATEELRGRIRKRLYEAQQCLEGGFTAAVLADDAFLTALLSAYREKSEQEYARALQRLRYAVRSMDEASIFTINGFCLRALTDHAFSSGQSFTMDLIRDDDALWQDALKDWWRRSVYELTPASLALFRGAFASLQSFLEAQAILRNAGDKRLLPQVRSSLDEVYLCWQSLREPVAEIARQWRADGESYRDILRSSSALSRTVNTGYKLVDLELSFVKLQHYFTAEEWFNIPASLELLSAAYLADNNTPARRGTDPNLELPFFVECASLMDKVQQLRADLRNTVLQGATIAAREQMERQKRLTHTLSYQDQLSRLRDALRSPSGEALAAQLRAAYPVAMIDEFQDTDTLQYEIFQRLYLAADAVQAEGGGSLSLLLIGDPKQAIYGFRGGDIFAYAMARRDAGEQRYTLDTNWRSVPSLVSAVNALFQRQPTPFVYEDIIAFSPVQAAPKTHRPLLEKGVASAALRFWQFGAAPDGKAYGSGVLRPLVSEVVADEIVRLLSMGQQGTATLGEQAVVPGDIAVLVRTGKEGVSIREALASRGVSAVTVGAETVFRSEEAKALAVLLQAVVHCRDRLLLRAGLSSPLLALNYEEIAALVDEQQAWLGWTQQMRALNALWAQRGFMAMFHAMLHGLDLPAKLAQQQDAERRLTNLLHLGELLQQNARALPGLESLLSWYQQQLEDSAEDATELRLESDEALVKIVTIHASKGLEYPIVFAPFLWSCLPRGKHPADKHGFSFHDADEQASLALDAASMERHESSADRERLAEDVRLVYVALTRAKAKLYCVWGMASWHAHPGKTALAWLLHGQADAAEIALSHELVTQGLDDLQKAAPGLVEVLPLPARSTPMHWVRDDAATPILQARHFGGKVATDWRINSFSSLTRDVHQPAMARSKEATQDPILAFTAGSRVGLFLHDVLEHLDFQGDIASQARVLNGTFAKKYGFEAQPQEALLSQWLSNIVTTSLNAEGFSLSQLAGNKRLNELAFDFGLNKLSIPTLNRLLTQWSGMALAPLQLEDFRGMITGVIDLVFEYEGRYYIADYKSNLLGTRLQDYRPEALREAVFERRYDLQYLLYLLALHRYLKQRIPDYHYDSHMGGVYYLFLRGMRPAHGAAYGVYVDRPDFSLIDVLDRDVFGFSAAWEEHP